MMMPLGVSGGRKRTSMEEAVRAATVSGGTSEGAVKGKGERQGEGEGKGEGRKGEGGEGKEGGREEGGREEGGREEGGREEGEREVVGKTRNERRKKTVYPLHCFFSYNKGKACSRNSNKGCNSLILREKLCTPTRVNNTIKRG